MSRKKKSSEGSVHKVEYVERDPEELAQDYQDQLEMLVLLCEQFDKGNIRLASEIAVNLRSLFYDKPDERRPNTSSRSIMFQMGKLDSKMIDTCYSVTKAEPYWNLEPASGLVYATSYLKDGKHYQDWMPTFQLYIEDDPYFLPLDKWLSRPILISGKENKYSRLRVLKDVANQERGAHRAPKLHRDYFELSRVNGKYASSIVPGDGVANLNLYAEAKNRIDILQTGGALRLVQSVVRQIAHETLFSLLSGRPKSEYLANLPPFVASVLPIFHINIHYTEDIYAS